MIGSLHYWGSDNLLIHVHDLGIAPANRELLRRWKNVIVHDVDFSKLPDHFRNIPLVAYKARLMLVTKDLIATSSSSKLSSKGRERVIEEENALLLWIDANTEVRRPLSQVFSRIWGEGYFLTLAGHKFPTYQTVRNETLEFFGVDTKTDRQEGGGQFVLQNECTSAIMGFQTKR